MTFDKKKANVMNGMLKPFAVLLVLALLALSLCAAAEDVDIVPAEAVDVEMVETDPAEPGEAVIEDEVYADDGEASAENVEREPEEVEADFGFEEAAPVEPEEEPGSETLPEEPGQETSDETEEQLPQPEEPPVEVTPEPTPEPTPTPAPTEEPIQRERPWHVGKKGNAKRVPVLAYHRIVSDEEKHTPELIGDCYTISLTKFTREMDWLEERGYSAITCEELYLWRIGKLRLPRRSVLITFDDGYASTVEFAYRVLAPRGLRGTMFIIGEKSTDSDGSNYVTVDRIHQLQQECPCIEFQSHTWNIHKKIAYQWPYETFVEDAMQQRAHFGFDFVAYPFGRYSKPMIQAYREDGIKMAFLFGRKKNGYATRRQNLFKIKRIDVTGDMSLRRFKRWCK